MRQTALESRIADMIEPVVAERGLALVCVRLTGENGVNTLQVMAEDPATRNIGVDDCAKLSREIAAILDVEDPIQGRYRLEVSSPGIDRPLTRERDFDDFAGLEARIEIAPAKEGQKRFKGLLRGVEDGAVRLDTETGPVELPLESIQKARLVLNDDLIAKTGKKD